MKLITFQTPDGRIAIGCVDVERCAVLDLQYMHTVWLGEPCPALDSMLSLMRAGPAGVDLVRTLLGKSNSSAARHLPLDQIRLLAPVPVPEQIRDFSGPGGTKALLAGIFGVAAPTSSEIQINSVDVCCRQPIYYISNRFNVIGSDADVAWPDYCDYLDFELEFGVFIGATGKDVTPDRASDFIFGYSLFNDFSARDQQMLEMPGLMGPTKGNSFDTANAIGPWIVTPDEVPDPTALAACVRVNGEVWAATTTGNCLYTFADMITFVSRSETLHPGEFLASGAIGDCCGLELDRWIKPGDLIEIEIKHLGVLRNRVVRTAA